jgi:hypothetical protein
MGFLNPVFLFALGAVSIPLIIHFLSKRRISTIEFSSLKFLEQMQKSRMKWLKIKEILLLILRMAVIALIVAAFARPTLRGFAGSSGGASSVAIILDRSASMEAQGETGSVFDEARRAAANLVAALEPADKVTIIPYPSSGMNSDTGPLNPGSRLRKNMSDIEPGFARGDIGAPLERALEILNNSPDLNREIYIFSDLQGSGWTELPAPVLQKERWSGINLFLMAPDLTGPENVGITDILLPPQMLIPGETFEIEAELVNYGTGTLENVLVGVAVNDERKAQATVSLRPGQPSKVSFKFKLDNPGRHSGYVEIDYDRYSLDNKRYFTLDIPERIGLLAVGQTESSLKFPALALDRPESGQISYRGIGAGDILRQDLGRYDVILLCDLKNLDPAREGAVEKFIGNGGGLFISLGRLSDPGYWSPFLQRNAAIETGELMGETGEYVIWDNFDYEHPVFSVYSGDAADRSRPDIPDINLVYYMDLKGGKTLGSTSNGINLMAESINKPLIVYSSGLDLVTGDLPAHSFFVPLLVRSIEYLGSQNYAAEQAGILGEMFTRKIEPVSEELILISPSGETVNINPASSAGGAMISFVADGPPGVYELATNRETLSVIAFNVDPGESSGEIVSESDVEEMLGIEVNTIEPGTDLKTSVKEARFGRELWKEFLLAALVLLIIESILGRTTPPSASSEKPE